MNISIVLTGNDYGRLLDYLMMICESGSITGSLYIQGYTVVYESDEKDIKLNFIKEDHGSGECISIAKALLLIQVRLLSKVVNMHGCICQLEGYTFEYDTEVELHNPVENLTGTYVGPPPPSTQITYHNLSIGYCVPGSRSV